MTTVNTLNAGTPSRDLNVINASFEKIFSKAFMQAAPQANFVQQRTSTGKWVDLAALLQTPLVRIWKDQKRVNSLNFNFSPVAMAPLEASIGIDKFDIKGDAVGIYGDAVASLGAQGKMFTDFAFASCVQAGYASEYSALVSGGELDFGASNTIFGDQLFLSGSGGSGGHTYQGTNVASQNNIVYGQLSDPLTWGNAVNLMKSFVGDKGQPIRVRPTGVVFGPSDTYAVLNALQAKFAGIDQRPTITSTPQMPKVALDNVITSLGLQLHEVDTLYNNPGVAYLIGEVNGVSAFYQYMLEQLHLVPSVDPTSYNVFFDREFIWSMEGFGRLIAPMWQTVIRVVDPTAAHQ